MKAAAPYLWRYKGRNKTRPFQKREGSATRNSQTYVFVLTYWSDIIQLLAHSTQKKGKGWPPAYTFQVGGGDEVNE